MPGSSGATTHITVIPAKAGIQARNVGVLRERRTTPVVIPAKAGIHFCHRGERLLPRSGICAIEANARSTASARERAGYFCLGKSNQNRSLLTRAAAARRCPVLLGNQGTSPKLAALRSAQTVGDSTPLIPCGARLALSRWKIKGVRQKQKRGPGADHLGRECPQVAGLDPGLRRDDGRPG